MVAARTDQSQSSTCRARYSAALKTAVDRCLAAVTSGENCCSSGAAYCGAGCNSDMADWDTSLVTDMSSLFERKSSFNQDISGWNVGAVTDMSSMFNNAGSFNRDLNTWDVSNVLDMSGMFGGNGGMNFNGDITGWNVGKVQDMSGMFVFQTKFDKNLGSWNVFPICAGCFNMPRLSTAIYRAGMFPQ